MEIIIGIDDTDNLESRGTGHLARILGKAIYDAGLGETLNITRHQLLVDSRIPYTSHNSSASLVLKNVLDIQKIVEFCRSFLIENSAEGSDVGLCVAKSKEVNQDIVDWGLNAKKIVLLKSDSYRLAEQNNIVLEGLRGTKDGVIGSLAAVGLRADGNDGRILWTKNLRETQGVFSVQRLKELINVDIITDKFGRSIPDNSFIFADEWTRPVVRNKLLNLIVEEVNDGEYSYRVASKEYIKSISE